NDVAPTEFSPLPLHDALPILTYMEARLLADDLKLVPKDAESRVTAAAANPVGKAPAGQPAGPAKAAGVSLKVDQVAIPGNVISRSEEHTSELQSLTNLVCRLL